MLHGPLSPSVMFSDVYEGTLTFISQCKTHLSPKLNSKMSYEKQHIMFTFNKMRASLIFSVVSNTLWTDFYVKDKFATIWQPKYEYMTLTLWQMVAGDWWRSLGIQLSQSHRPRDQSVSLWEPLIAGKKHVSWSAEGQLLLWRQMFSVSSVYRTFSTTWRDLS